MYEGFESPKLQGWEIGRDLPHDPNNPGSEVGWEVVASTERPYRGNLSLRLTIDGRQDDGTVWIARSVKVDHVAEVEVRLEFRFWSPFKGSINNLAYAVGYIGLQAPAGEQSFVRIAPVAEIGEWDLLELTETVQKEAVAETGEIWVAVGFSVVWETQQTYFIDEVRVATEGSAIPTAVEEQSWSAVKTYTVPRFCTPQP